MADTLWDITAFVRPPHGIPHIVGRTVLAPAEWGWMMQAIVDRLNLDNGTMIDMVTLAPSSEEW